MVANGRTLVDLFPIRDALRSAILALACWALFIGVIGLPFAAFGGL